MKTLYVDVAFALNLTVDYLLLLTTAQLMGTALLRARFLLVSCIGGGYAVLSVIVPRIAHPSISVLVGILMSMGAFCGQVRLWRSTALFLLLSGGLGGMIYAVSLYGYFNGWVLLLTVGAFYLLLELCFYQAARYGRQELMNTTVMAGGKKCRLKTLYDTGNGLRNPVDGHPVLVAEEQMLRRLWDKEVASAVEQALPPEKILMRLHDMGCHRFSLLPYRAVGREDGLLLAFRSDYICIDGRCYRNTLIALSPQSIGGAAYHALWGGKEDCHAFHGSDPEMDQTTQAG